MIDAYNQYYLSDERRREVLQRALYSFPYFYKMVFPFISGQVKQPSSSAKVGINRDFYLTEVVSDGGEQYNLNAADILLTLYTQYNKSAYRFEAGRKLPQSFIATDARFRSQLANHRYDDRQHETFPFLIRSNDKIFGEATSISPVDDDGDYTVVLKGFSLIDSVYVDPMQTQQLNESLANPVRWEFFKFKVETTDTGRKTYIIDNDKFPRMILGFGVVPTTQNLPTLPDVRVTITDVARRVRLTDDGIPLSFIAPIQKATLDQHIYYLPIEYYFNPLAKLQFDLDITQVNGESEGVEIAVLTRTV